MPLLPPLLEENAFQIKHLYFLHSSWLPTSNWMGHSCCQSARPFSEKVAFIRHYMASRVIKSFITELLATKNDHCLPPGFSWRLPRCHYHQIMEYMQFWWLSSSTSEVHYIRYTIWGRRIASYHHTFYWFSFYVRSSLEVQGVDKNLRKLDSLNSKCSG